MNKKQIQKEFAALRRLKKQIDRQQLLLQKQSQALAEATCPFKVGDILMAETWRFQGKRRVQVKRVGPGRLKGDYQEHDEAWSIYVKPFLKSQPHRLAQSGLRISDGDLMMREGRVQKIETASKR